MPAPATHDFVHLEISSASVLNTSVNGPLNYLIGRDTGSDDATQIEDSLEILSGSGGRYLRLPQGTTGQRPTGAVGLLRLNTTLGNLDYHDGTAWEQPLTPEAVTFAALNTSGGVGGSVNQVAQGNHNHLRDGVVVVSGTETSSAPDGTQIELLQFVRNVSAAEFWALFMVGAVSSGGDFGEQDIFLYRNNIRVNAVGISDLQNGWRRAFGTVYDPDDGNATWSLRWIKSANDEKTLEWSIAIIAYDHV